MNKYLDFSEEELIKKLDRGFEGEDDLNEILEAMKEKGMKGGLIGFDDDSADSAVSREYVDYHKKLLSDKPSKRELKAAIKMLSRKSLSNEETKLAIITLAHSNKIEALRALEKFEKKINKGELKTWVKIAIQECKMFIEAELSDEPKIKLTNVSGDTVCPKASNVRRLLEHFFRDENDEEVRRALNEFTDGELDRKGQISLDNEEGEAQMSDWIVYDYRFSNGKGLVENFLDENAEHLSVAEKKSFEEMLLNKFGFFEVKAIEPEKSISLESLHSHKMYKAVEKMGTRGSRVGDILICRVGKQNGIWRMVGCNPMVVPFQFTKNARKMFEGDNRPLTPKDFRSFVRRIQPR